VAQSMKASAPSPVPATRTRRIVVADDNRDAADSLAMLLKMDGHDVTVVYDGPQALAAIRQKSPDVALLDIGMPGMNGYEVARAVRSDYARDSLMLVAVTGWGQQADIAAAKAAGFDRHFTKPIDPDQLAAMMVNAAPA
jgi:CheY-like chemotaxis protein